MNLWIILVLGMTIGSGMLVASDDCESVEIMKCLTVSQSSGEERLLFPDTQQKLERYCRHLMAGLGCAKRLIEQCASEADKAVYNNLTKDMVGMNEALCTPGSSLSTRFLKHVDCYKNLSDRFRVCSDRYIGNIIVVHSLSQEEQVRMTCCTVHEYNKCMRIAIEGRCTRDAQMLIEDTVVTALKQSFGFCKQLGNIPTSNCYSQFSASKGHATGNLNEDSGTSDLLSRTPQFLYWFLILLTLIWS